MPKVSAAHKQATKIVATNKTALEQGKPTVGKGLQKRPRIGPDELREIRQYLETRPCIREGYANLWAEFIGRASTRGHAPKLAICYKVSEAIGEKLRQWATMDADPAGYIESLWRGTAYAAEFRKAADPAMLESVGLDDKLEGIAIDICQTLEELFP